MKNILLNRDKPLTPEQIEKVKNNIQYLSQGISLDEYLKNEKELLINGHAECYNQYGCFVIFINTKNVYTYDGGPGGFNMHTVIWMFFVTDEGRGNHFMHDDFIGKDQIVIKFLPFEGSSYANKDEMHDGIEREYDKIAESYYDLMVRTSENRYMR